MHAVKTYRSQRAAGICDAVKHMLTAARQRRRAEPEWLLDLDRRGKLAALRIVPGTAHFLEEDAAEVGDTCAALAGGRKKSCRGQLRVLCAKLILVIQGLFQSELFRIAAVLDGREGLHDLLLDFQSADRRGLGESWRRQRYRQDAPRSQQDPRGADANVRVGRPSYSQRSKNVH